MVKKVEKLIKQEQGQSLVEFAIIVPLFFLILVGIINFGMVLSSYLNLNFNAQEASRLAGLGKTDAEIVEFAKSNASFSNPSELGVTISPDEGSRESGDYVTVTLSYPVTNIIPIFDQLLYPYNLTAKATVRVE